MLRLFLFISIIAYLFSSCKDDESVFCTQEFRTIGITVNRHILDSYVTIRVANGDSIRIDRLNVPGNNEYPVLDDRFQSVLAGRTEGFRFKGFVRDSLVVDELFMIRADQCHIEYVSGNQVIN